MFKRYSQSSNIMMTLLLNLNVLKTGSTFKKQKRSMIDTCCTNVLRTSGIQITDNFERTVY